MAENIRILDFRTENIREISKKERAFGLNLKSWYFCVFIPLIANAWIGFLNAFFMFGFITCAFYIAEFFDEDISDIIFANFLIRNKSTNYYA